MPRLVVLLLLAALAALPFPGAAGAAGAESLRRALKTVHAPTGRPTLPVNPFVSSLEAKLGVLIPSANVAPCEALLGLLSSSANSVVLGLERSSVISVCGINSTSAVLSKFLHLFGVVVVDPVTSHPAPAPSPSIFISNPHNLTVAQAQLIAQLEDLISPFHSSSTSSPPRAGEVEFRRLHRGQVCVLPGPRVDPVHPPHDFGRPGAFPHCVQHFRA
jgi:hypothetical protein